MYFVAAAAHVVAKTVCCRCSVLVDLAKLEVGVDVGNLVCIVGFECVDMSERLCKNAKKNLKPCTRLEEFVRIIYFINELTRTS